MKPITILKKYKPLFFDHNDNLFLSKANRIYRMSKNGELIDLFDFPENLFRKNMFKISWLSRIKRLGVWSSTIFNDICFFSYNSKIYSYCLTTSSLQHEFSFKLGHGPLEFTIIEDIYSFEDGIYFGEYFSNSGRKPVSIYKRLDSGEWIKIYTFAENEINHIHSIVADPVRQCVWILAGDFEHSASIWLAKNNFSDVKPIFRGEQKYRACVAFPVQDGLIYATDTQITTNSLRIIKQINNQWTSGHLANINGSCIYGCELKDYFIFSTSSEPSNKKTNFFLSLIDTKPGIGIIENKSDVISLRKDNLRIKVLFSKKKDLLPYRLFQFGTIIFPKGKSNNNTIFSYSVGNITNDLSTEIYHLKNE